MLLRMFAGWVNRRQLEVIEYLQEENRVLTERMSGRRLRITDAERRNTPTDFVTYLSGRASTSFDCRHDRLT